MRTARQWALVMMLVLMLAGQAPSRPASAALAAQSSSLAMVSPVSCPGGSCAAGQRFNLLFDFQLSGYANVSPNVVMCVYSPSSWDVPVGSVDSGDVVRGELTGADYVRVSDCATDTPPTGYTMVVARQATIADGTFSDAVRISLNTGAGASGNGRFLARLFVNNGSGFTRLHEAMTPIFSMQSPGPTVFVANDAAACGSNRPCYINSGDDLDNGLGTGLRDAVLAKANAPILSTIVVLGNYTIKSNSVLIDQPVTLTGISDARITYSGSGPCNEPMLLLRSAIDLHTLTVNDGSCSNPNRSLLEINSSGSVVIESSDLTGGDNAIYIADNTGDVRIRYNHISGNGGYAIFSEGHSSGGALEVTANNLHANGSTIECSVTASGPVANRRVNHNYWGSIPPTQETSHCTLSAAKRLGAPIALRGSAPGVNVEVVTVRENKSYIFDNQVAFRRSGGSDYELYIVDHGFLSSGGVPFTTAVGEDSPSACSNYWDVFLPDGSSPAGTLELFFKYDQIAACQAAINSNQYCGQTAAPAWYPLYWYDPANGVTDGWDTTGQRPENLTTGEGQPTICHIEDSEIQVSIDNSGRPALATDLGYTPFMVALPILRSFQPLARNRTIDVTWTTNVEPDVTGFYVLRGLSSSSLSQIGEFIPRRGNALTGVTSPPYTYVDEGLENNVTYYYRLQIVRSNGNSDYSEIIGLAANIPTITPTFTISPTRTATVPRPTNTPQPTFIPTQRPTSLPTQSPTPRTETPTPTQFILQTSTAGTPETPPTGEGTAGTPIAMIGSITPNPTATATLPSAVAGQQSGQASWTWISLLLGILAGLAAVAAAGGWWWYTRSRL